MPTEHNEQIRVGDIVKRIIPSSFSSMPVGSYWKVTDIRADNIFFDELKKDPWLLNNYELVERPKEKFVTKFKIGDRVKRVYGSDCRGMSDGSEHIITNIISDGTVLCFKNEKSGWDTRYFELVSENAGELQRLVNVANAGMRAREKLSEEYGDKVENKNNNQKWQLLNQLCFSTGSEYRIKPVPAFEPFRIGKEQWNVTLERGTDEGDIVRVGCVNFKVEKLIRALKALVRENITVYEDNSTTPFRSTRNGVQYKTHILPWADAEKLLTALEKAGAKPS